ncbi:MAG: DUF3365 domain-containing protein [Pseudomonadota bacterium]
MFRFTLLIAALSLIAFAAGPPAAAEPANDTEHATLQGAAIIKPYKNALQTALREGLADSPLSAVEHCRLEAPALAERYSTENLRVGRSSHRLRNPANAAPDWLEAVLDRYLGDPSTRAPLTVELEHGVRGYVEPIVMQPLCLACHGPALAPELEAMIEKHYPDDQATGFEVGDLRGVFWVEFTPAQR